MIGRSTCVGAMTLLVVGAAAGVSGACRREAPTAAAAAPSVGSAPAVDAARPPPAREPRLVVARRKCMGTECVITAFHPDEEAAQAAMARGFDEMDRVEALMTDWRESSEVARLNAAAGGPAVPVSPDTMAVLVKARWVAELSDGAFDVTMGAFRGVWKFDEDNDGSLPDPRKVRERLKLVGYRDLLLDEKAGTARLRRKGQVINLGGIAKGYAVDAGVSALRAAGLRDFMVHAGGDLFAAGRRGDRPWSVGIQDPRARRSPDWDPANPKTTVFATLHVTDAAFSTSGDYERFIIKDGKRYHHILDPRTGYPAKGCRSVTIWARTAFLADALDTALFVLGPERAMSIIEDLPDVEGVVVTAENRVLVSSGLRDKLKMVGAPTDGP